MALYSSSECVRRRLSSVLALTVILSGSAGLISCKSSQVPDLDYLPPGELLSSQKELPPQDVKLRPIFPPGIALTKSSEGWVPHLYNDAVKYCTIGYGHLIRKAPCNGTEPAEFRNGLSKPRGEEILVGDLASSQYSIMTSVKIPLTDGQFAALTDFVFNVGSANFRSSTLLQVVNANQHDKVPAQLRRWVLANGKPLAALETRREREIELFSPGLPKTREIPAPGENLTPIDIHKGE
jgi:lysozyme